MEETKMTVANIFERTSKKTNRPYFTMSIIAEDGSFEDAGFVHYSKNTKARELYEGLKAKGLLKKGVSDAGEYTMLSAKVEIEEVEGQKYITSFVPFL